MKRARSRIQDVAILAHTSISTVSRVISGGKNVDQATKEKVEKAIRELGYIPSASARAMRLEKTHMAGLLVPDMTSGYHALLSQTIKDDLFKKGYLTMIGTTFGNFDMQRAYVSSFISQRVDGLVILSSFFPNPVEPSSFKGIPTVFLNIFSENSKIPTVNQDVWKGVEDALKDLRSFGHEKVGYLPGPVENLPLLGEYGRALRQKGLEIFGKEAVKIFARTEISIMASYDDFMTPFPSSCGNLSFKKRCEKVGGILESLLSYGIRAVIAGYGPDALALYICLRSKGIPIGRGGISVISFGNVSMGSFISPSLSSIEVPAIRMGLAASEKLQRIMSGKTANNSKIEASYVHRQSVGAAEKG